MKKSKFSKNFIVVIVSITFIIGIIASFKNSPIDMNSYKDFLQVFGIVFVPLILSVAGGRAFKNYINKDIK